MKRTATLSLILMLSASSVAFAQSSDMKGMEMKKDMPMQKQTMTHKAVAVVKAVDPAKGQVILAHEPIKTLNWPAMTMRFGVTDKMLFDKLAVGKKVNVDIVQQGSDYVVTAVK